MENKQPTTLHLIVRKRETILFSGEVLSLTSTNDRGRFDVLPGHENFITVISSFLQCKQSDGSEKQFELTTGVMRVQQNTVNVYLDVTKA